MGYSVQWGKVGKGTHGEGQPLRTIEFLFKRKKLNRQGKPANYKNYLTVISMTYAAEKILTCLNKGKNTTILQEQCISIRNQ